MSANLPGGCAMSRGEMIAQAGAGVTARGRDARQRSRRHSDHRSRLGRGVVARRSAGSQRRADHAVGTHTETFGATRATSTTATVAAHTAVRRAVARAHCRPTAQTTKIRDVKKLGRIEHGAGHRIAGRGTGIHRPNPVRTDASGVRKAHHWLGMRAHDDRRLTRLCLRRSPPRREGNPPQSHF